MHFATSCWSQRTGACCCWNTGWSSATGEEGRGTARASLSAAHCGSARRERARCTDAQGLQRGRGRRRRRRRRLVPRPEHPRVCSWHFLSHRNVRDLSAESATSGRRLPLHRVREMPGGDDDIRREWNDPVHPAAAPSGTCHPLHCQWIPRTWPRCLPSSRAATRTTTWT